MAEPRFQRDLKAFGYAVGVNDKSEAKEFEEELRQMWYKKISKREALPKNFQLLTLKQPNKLSSQHAVAFSARLPKHYIDIYVEKKMVSISDLYGKDGINRVYKSELLI